MYTCIHKLFKLFFPFSTGTSDKVSSESDDEDFHIKVPPPLPQSDTGTTESSSSDTNKGTLRYFNNNTCSSQATGSPILYAYSLDSP